jgi:DNA-binding CsgD family transcriptional regulator/tetratricopeptide (TPR) repeat protein
MAAPVSFVGRAGELSRLLAALGGGVRLVLVVGDAGVGKSRFAGEAMARAAAAGVVMVRGECLPLAETLPLLPVGAALGELARLDDGRVMRAALDAAAGYVREEVGRLVPGLAADAGPVAGGAEGWRRGRLFSAVGELLNAAGSWDAQDSQPGIGLVIEDVHWADGATLDFLTFLVRGGDRGAVCVVATCRGDEALAGQVADWLAGVRGAAGVEEIRLAPLSREEVAGQVAALAGGPVAAGVADELYARAEGNPFFTEQLVAAALADAEEGALRVPAGLPARLAELLTARADRCTGAARAVLAGLAVAGRPLAEDLLAAVSGLDADAVRGGLRELAAARLLADDTSGGTHRPRHALLAEAMAGSLLPGERAVLHERTARALAATWEETLAAEVAGHWQAASCPAEELPTRVAAAEAAERVFGYAEAATHWQRAIELAQTRPGAMDAASIDVLALHLRAIDALEWSGMGVRAEEIAEEALHRFADVPDPATAAAVRHRAAVYRAIENSAAGLALIEEALRLFEQAPRSGERAKASFDYAEILLQSPEGRLEDASAALRRALEIAEETGTAALIPLILARLAVDACQRGKVGEGFALLTRGWELARVTGDGEAAARLAVTESDLLLKQGQFERAAEAALRGIEPARQVGLHASHLVAVLIFNAHYALLEGGRTAEAAALIDPLTAGPPDRDHWPLHEARAELDLLRGDTAAAAARRRLIDAIPAHLGIAEFAIESAQRAAELALWDRRSADALGEVQRVLLLLEGSDLAMLCGRLLATGMRACADLAEWARARRDEPALQAAMTAADSLVSWAGLMASAPFSDHPFIGTIPAERATWDAEQTRLSGASDPAAWHAAAKAWEALGCPHRAGYARWRQAQAQLDGGQPAAAAGAALRAATDAAGGHAPLQAQIRLLAERARIPLQPAAAGRAPGPARTKAPYGLTARELAVLRLLATGCTNAQIGAELYISPSTASVHVTSILRKLGASGRVQAAAIAERAGLLPVSGPNPGPTEN